MLKLKSTLHSLSANTFATGADMIIILFPSNKTCSHLENERLPVFHNAVAGRDDGEDSTRLVVGDALRRLSQADFLRGHRHVEKCQEKQNVGIASEIVALPPRMREKWQAVAAGYAARPWQIRATFVMQSIATVKQVKRTCNNNEGEMIAGRVWRADRDQVSPGCAASGCRLLYQLSGCFHSPTPGSTEADSSRRSRQN